MKNSPYTDRLVGMFESLMQQKQTNYSKLAESIVIDGKPMTRQALFRMVKGGSLKVTMLMRVLDELGAELNIVS